MGHVVGHLFVMVGEAAWLPLHSEIVLCVCVCVCVCVCACVRVHVCSSQNILITETNLEQSHSLLSSNSANT